MTEQVKEESYTTTLARAERMVTIQANNLSRIADALELIGNGPLANKLYGIAEMLDQAANDISDGNSAAVGRHFAAANDGTTNMVNACLAILSIKDRTVVDHQSDGEASAAVSEADGPHA